MAKLILQGDISEIQLVTDPEDGTIIAQCIDHALPNQHCRWEERYDDLNDASEYAAEHADRG